MNKILVYSHENEPVTKSLLNMMQDIYPISLRDFLDKATVFDEVNEYGAFVSWEFPDGKIVRNCDNTFLINRVIGIPDELFMDFDVEDREYAKFEFRAYLTFALSVFPNAFGQPGAFGINENRYSLPRQWEMVKTMNPNLATPEYFLGDIAKFTNHSRLVCSNPNNYYFWRPSIKDTSFAFIKPFGEPIVSSSIGEDVRIYTFNKNFSLSVDQSNKILQYSTKLSKLFSYKIFEALFFASKNTISFGMASPIPYYSSKMIGFQNQIHHYFTKITNDNYRSKYFKVI